MEAEKGKQVRISFSCRLEDGTPFTLEQKTLQLILGKEQLLPTLQDGIVGMQAGERKVVEVPAGEVRDFLARNQHPAAVPRPAFGYDFGPGEGGDVLLTVPQPPLKPAPELPQGVRSVLFEVTVMAPEGAPLKKA